MKNVHRFPKSFCGFLWVAIAISFGGYSAANAEDNSQESKTETIQCNTKVDWYPDWREAMAIAEKSGKPLFVLHLSGNLRNEKFT